MDAKLSFTTRRVVRIQLIQAAALLLLMTIVFAIFGNVFSLTEGVGALFGSLARNLAPHPVYFLYGLIAAVPLLGINFLFGAIVKVCGKKYDGMLNVVDLTPTRVVLIAAVSGFCEELFFRGVLQQSFGIWVATTVFAVMHFSKRGAGTYTLLTFVLGLSLGWMFMHFGTLWVPIVAHATNNAVSFSFKLRKQRKQARQIDLSASEHPDRSAPGQGTDEEPDEPPIKFEELSDGRVSVRIDRGTITMPRSAVPVLLESAERRAAELAAENNDAECARFLRMAAAIRQYMGTQAQGSPFKDCQKDHSGDI